MGHSFIQEGTLNVVNLSSGADVGNGNLTVDYELGIAYTKKNLYNRTALGLTYTWGAKEVRENIIDSSINGFEVMENTSNYGSLVVLALVIGVIFVIILGVASTSGIGGSRGGGSLWRKEKNQEVKDEQPEERKKDKIFLFIFYFCENVFFTLFM